jgi:hypothetical protein
MTLSILEYTCGFSIAFSGILNIHYLFDIGINQYYFINAFGVLNHFSEQKLV